VGLQDAEDALQETLLAAWRCAGSTCRRCWSMRNPRRCDEFGARHASQRAWPQRLPPMPSAAVRSGSRAPIRPTTATPTGFAATTSARAH